MRICRNGRVRKTEKKKNLDRTKENEQINSKTIKKKAKKKILERGREKNSVKDITAEKKRKE